MERRRVIYTGRVQGVGFRFAVCTIAERYAVAGWVRNLHDGRVEALAEGKKESLEEFFRQVASAMGGNIRGTEQFIETATGEFTGFRQERTV